MRDDDRIRIYPEYFDASLTRKEGRRVSKKMALENPTLGELKISAEKLHYGVEYSKETAYPRQWHSPKGVLYVSASETTEVAKTKLLKDLSKTVKEFARPYLTQKMKEERAKADALAGKKSKPHGPVPGKKPADKKQAGKPIRRRR